MKKLKIILQSNYLYLILILISLFLIILNYNLNKNINKFIIRDNEIIGIIEDIDYKEQYVVLTVKSKEKILCYYYGDLNKKNKDFLIGNKIKLNGTISKPKNNTIPNTFNYKKYLSIKKIYYIFTIDKYEILEVNKNIFRSIKNKILIKLSDNTKTNNYLKSFILGKNEINNNIKNNYQNMGVSHLLAISGMHISFLIGNIKKILDKFSINKCIEFILMFFLLIFYMYLVNFTPSILRSGVMFILDYLNNILKLDLSKKRIFILTICFLIIVNPFIVFDIGFIFSFVISFYLIFFSKIIELRKNYITKSFFISLISWLSSIPIILYNNFSINMLTIFYNLLCVPLVTLIIFPLSFVTFVFKKISIVYIFFINILEQISIFSNKINTNITLGKPSFIFIILYYIFITFVYLGIQQNNNKRILIIIVFLLVYYKTNIISTKSSITYFDVNQGDSILININRKSILIDTGGNIYSNKIILNEINYMKSIRILKIDYLILSHGDYDHIGESINLVNNFKVENVIFNCGEYNSLEKELIEVLEKKNIKYYSCIKELNIDKYKLQFLNTKEYNNENDNSNVIYFNYENNKFLFMGDAEIEKERDILKKYNLNDIDFLKVGHHGSNTSSSEEFINSIKPKFSLISVGKNNRYGHPKESVLDTLSKSKIYRTDLDGSIEIKLNKNGYKIRTCPP